MSYIYPLIAFVVFLSGCSTSAVKVTDAKPVPAERYLWREKPKTNNPAKIILVRDVGWIGAGGTIKATIDDKPFAVFWPGEKAVVELDPDEYVLNLDFDSIFYESEPLTQNVAAGKTYLFRIYSDDNLPSRIIRGKVSSSLK